MQSENGIMQRLAFWLALGSPVAAIFSIAVSQILLALALAALLVSGLPLRFPPIRLPLGLFVAVTIVSAVLAENPAATRPQLRKFFIFLALLVVYSAFRELAQVRYLVYAWGGAATLAAARAFMQLNDRLGEARRLGKGFYEHYIADRISGFMSHWMTFAGEQMIVLMMLAAFILFYKRRRGAHWFWIVCAAAISASIVLNFTRGVWIATAAGAVYLLWSWKRWTVLLLPLALVAGLWLGPQAVRTRALSTLKPSGDLDSNQHRIVTWRTGWNMIRAKPLFGVGPEHVRTQFDRHVPPDVPRPLPSGWYGHLHNNYLHYAAERGVPAVLILLWLFGKMLFDFLRAVRKLPAEEHEARFVLHGAVAVLIAVLVEGLFELNLGDSEVLLMFLAAVSCGYVAVDRARLPAAQP